MRIAALTMVLVVVKALIVTGREMPLNWWMPVAYLWHDAALVIAFAAVEAAAALAGANHRGRSAAVAWVVYAAVVAYVVVNLPVMRVLATPMTWPMWRAARGPLADSIWRYATVDTLLLCSLVTAVGVVAPIVFRRIDRACSRALIAGLVLFTAVGPMAAARVDTRGLERNAFSALLTAAIPIGAADASDWSAVGFEPTAGDDLKFLRGAAAGRHIILVSLESAGAQYLVLNGARQGMTPNLSELSQPAIVFDAAYAVYPESIKGLYSLLCSTCPALNDDTGSYASAPCASIADVVARRGYRTALFHSGRFDYLGMDTLVRNRGYELLADAGDIGGQHQSSFGVDEPSTVARILAWIDGLPSAARFFVTYLPVAGHHPYDTPERGPYDDRSEEGRYRNALHYADASLGILMRGLAARGLTDNVLWIVAGDHGEAFGQHDGNYGHTFHVYDENVRVPLVIAAPGLIPQQRRSRQLTTLLDVAPTLLDLLGDPAPNASYQGHSMLDGVPQMIYFFTNYSRPLVGIRDGPLKMILELDTGRARLFDLESDPGETRNVADAFPDRVAWYSRNARHWAAAHQGGRQPLVQ